MRSSRVVIVMTGLAMLLTPLAAHAYSHVIWIEYNQSTNPANGIWSIPTDPDRPSMLGPWDAWADEEKTQPLNNLYCIEPSVYESTGQFHSYAYDPYYVANWDPPLGGTNAGLRWATYILEQVDPGMNSNDGLTRAALQLAVWEALYDYDIAGNAFADASFDSGGFQISSISAHYNNQIRATAEGYLNMYQGQSTNATVYHDGQDLIRLGVPEPGTLLLLGVGLAIGSAVTVRRRQRRA